RVRAAVGDWDWTVEALLERDKKRLPDRRDDARPVLHGTEDGRRLQAHNSPVPALALSHSPGVQTCLTFAVLVMRMPIRSARARPSRRHRARAFGSPAAPIETETGVP